MINFLFLALLSCAKNKPVEAGINPPSLDNSNCIESLKIEMKKVGCPELSYKYYSDYEIFIRCHKKDSDRTNEWDTNIFRISHISLAYTEESFEIVREHTICEDNFWRIESYMPSERF